MLLCVRMMYFLLLIANVLKISPLALKIPSVNCIDELLHMLFALEDQYGLSPEINCHMRPVLTIRPTNCETPVKLNKELFHWAKMVENKRVGIISKEEYDNWKANYSIIEPS